jgi:hypothetical protein
MLESTRVDIPQLDTMAILSQISLLAFAIAFALLLFLVCNIPMFLLALSHLFSLLLLLSAARSSSELRELAP